VTIFHEIFFIFRLNLGMFCEILSIPHNIVMDLNNVMLNIDLFHSFNLGKYTADHFISMFSIVHISIRDV
jgi:hypothetical protein